MGHELGEKVHELGEKVHELVEKGTGFSCCGRKMQKLAKKNNQIAGKVIVYSTNAVKCHFNCLNFAFELIVRYYLE